MLSESAIILVRRAIIMPQEGAVVTPRVLMVKRAPAPISKIEALKLECPGTRVHGEEAPIETLIRGVKKECGLTVVSIDEDKKYDYSRPTVYRDAPQRKLYVAYHYDVRVEPFTLKDVRLTSKHTEARLADLLEILELPPDSPNQPCRLSTLSSLRSLAEDLGLIK